MRHRLLLDGVHHWSRIFVNGVHRRDHIGGFTRFGTDFTPEHETVTMTVLVDNRFDYDRCPLHLPYFDWYHYGGIARGAELHRLNTLWLEGVVATTAHLEPPTLHLAVHYAALEPPGEQNLEVSFGGEIVLQESVRLSEVEGRLERTLSLPSASLWSPETPHLYELHVRLGADDWRGRIGLRQVRTEGQHLLINEVPVRLHGVNRHDAHPQFGHALPDALVLSDVQQLKDLGCTVVRGSHYPQDTRFLDLCDEVGLCVWSEAIGWQHTAEHLRDDAFLQAQERHIDEMIAAAINHPSVILWGALNECSSDDAASRPGYERLLSHIRKRDPSRPVAYASNRPYADKCFDLADIVAINSYPGWKTGELEDIPRLLDELCHFIDGSEHADKPLFIAELGADALPGWRDAHEDRWSEQYQAKVLETAIKHLMTERERACGLTLWQFGDLRTTTHPDKALRKARGFNNKGIVDEYRRPKLAYDAVKRCFHELRAKNKFEVTL